MILDIPRNTQFIQHVKDNNGNIIEVESHIAEDSNWLKLDLKSFKQIFKNEPHLNYVIRSWNNFVVYIHKMDPFFIGSKEAKSKKESLLSDLGMEEQSFFFELSKKGITYKQILEEASMYELEMLISEYKDRLNAKEPKPKQQTK